MSKGTITYTYDAGGNKIKKQTTDISTAGKIISTTSTYIAGMVYETKTTTPVNTPENNYTDKLQFIGQEEGRIRFKPAEGNIVASFQYDYMLKDHLGNVRMVLTEEQQQDRYPATTLEDDTYNGGTAISVEEKFYNITNTKIVLATTVAGLPAYQNNNAVTNNNPYSNTAADSKRLYLLNASNNTVQDKNGLGIVLKVMAGDAINIWGKSYHKMPAGGYTSATNPLSVLDLMNLLAASPTASPKGISGTQISGLPGFPANVTDLLNNQPPQNTDRPRASINWVVLDEQFKYVSGGFDMVGTATSTNGTFKDHTVTDIAIPKNGYIYVYCSNESQYDVFFDNLQVVHDRGAILEETHYYPFGLTMSGISSKAAGSLENKRKWNVGSELNTDFDINLYETFYRSLDPQIGRFWQVDPKPTEYESPYVSMGDNPISNVDPKGDYFFGLFGSTSDQRKSARAFAEQTGGDVKNITSKNVSVKFTFKAGEGSLNVGVAETKFSRNGAPNILGKEVKTQYDALKNGWGRINPSSGKFERILASGRVEMVDDPITMFGPSLLRGLLAKLGAAAAGAVEQNVAKSSTNALSEIRLTEKGESFIRYESENLAYSRTTPGGGVTPGTYAAPASDGLISLERRAATYNLPDAGIPRPNVKILEPPAGTPIIGPRPVSGGTGNEVLFPFGYH